VVSVVPVLSDSMGVDSDNSFGVGHLFSGPVVASGGFLHSSGIVCHGSSVSVYASAVSNHSSVGIVELFEVVLHSVVPGQSDSLVFLSSRPVVAGHSAGVFTSSIVDSSVSEVVSSFLSPGVCYSVEVLLAVQVGSSAMSGDFNPLGPVVHVSSGDVGYSSVVFGDSSVCGSGSFSVMVVSSLSLLVVLVPVVVSHPGVKSLSVMVKSSPGERSAAAAVTLHTPAVLSVASVGISESMVVATDGAMDVFVSVSTVDSIADLAVAAAVGPVASGVFSTTVFPASSLDLSGGLSKLGSGLGGGGGGGGGGLGCHGGNDEGKNDGNLSHACVVFI
jgi:hypothetical protein